MQLSIVAGELNAQLMPPKRAEMNFTGTVMSSATEIFGSRNFRQYRPDATSMDEQQQQVKDDIAQLLNKDCGQRFPAVNCCFQKLPARCVIAGYAGSGRRQIAG